MVEVAICLYYIILNPHMPTSTISNIKKKSYVRRKFLHQNAAENLKWSQFMVPLNSYFTFATLPPTTNICHSFNSLSFNPQKRKKKMSLCHHVTLQQEPQTASAAMPQRSHYSLGLVQVDPWNQTSPHGHPTDMHNNSRNVLGVPLPPVAWRVAWHGTCHSGRNKGFRRGLPVTLVAKGCTNELEPLTDAAGCNHRTVAKEDVWRNSYAIWAMLWTIMAAFKVSKLGKYNIS